MDLLRLRHPSPQPAYKPAVRQDVVHSPATSPEPSTLPNKLPTHLQGLLDQWYEEHGRLVPPPCANAYALNDDPHRRKDGVLTEFVHLNGQTMQAKRYPSGTKRKSVLVVQCEDFPPSIIKHWKISPGNWLEGWYVWLGSDMWEEQASVGKVVVGRWRTAGWPYELLDTSESSRSSLGNIHVARHCAGS
jgi:hypothetical protein